MKTLELGYLGRALAVWGASAVVIGACGPLVSESGESDSMGDTTTAGNPTVGSQDGASVDDGNSGSEPPPNCPPEGPCYQIDLVLVIDNSGTMGEEQLNLARNLPQLVDQLMSLTDADGDPVSTDVNIMVTTTDYGHPLCTTFQKPDYEPRQGAPVYTGCNSRIQRFTGLDPMDPLVIEEACTESCPADVAPIEPFINFGALGTNVPDDDVQAALSCIGPQGIDGCGYEATLETMLRAIEETACWNDPSRAECDAEAEWAALERGFLRDDAILALAIVTDEMDCSVAAPDGWSYFTNSDEPTYWEVNPDVGVPQATSAICFNAGVSCDDANGDGIYESCALTDNGVLHPVDRYTGYFDYLTEQRDKHVVMLGIFGVPPVVSRNPNPPYQSTGGGALDLVYRQWVDFPYPAGDILPAEWEQGIDAIDKTFEFGALGPGCTGTDELGNFTGQALPPLRLREACESLDYVDEAGEPQVRCCIESICDTDFSPAIRCLTGLLTEVVGD